MRDLKGNKNIKRFILLSGSLIFLCVCCLKAQSIYAEQQEVMSAQSSVPDIGNETKDEKWVSADIGNRELLFQAWHNENDNKHYFFFPEYLDREINWGENLLQEAAEVKQMDLSEIPVLYIEMGTEAFDAIKGSKEEKKKATFFLIESDRGVKTEQLEGTIKTRGNASFNAPRYKKSYTVVFEDEKNVYDMPRGKEWVLLAHYYDDTHLRDYLTFDMARTLEMAYVPQGKFVNLYIAGEFQGIYFLCEKINISPTRLDITNLEEKNQEKLPNSILKEYPYEVMGVRGGQNIAIEKGYKVNDTVTDVSGGYLLELEYLKERFAEGKSGFTSDGNQSIVIKGPQYATRNQVTYIKNCYQKFEDALNKSIEEDSEDYLEYIDLDSFVNKYLIEEVSKNMDANLSSQYLYKDSDMVDNKLYAGPVWDYDRAYDNKVGDVNNRGTDMFWVNQGKAGFDFWQKLYETSVFEERVKEVYCEKLSPILDKYADEKIWVWESQIHDSIIADMFRYQDEYQVQMDPEERISIEMKALSDFIKNRKRFLDKEWG